MKINKRKLSLKERFAFTLAEILIVVGIIGIVSTITIPSLTNKIQDIQFKIAAKKTYSVSSSIVNQIREENGGTLSSYESTAYSFKPVFMQYFKVIKDCGWQSCVPRADSSDIYTSLYGTKAYTQYGGFGQFVTADGVFFNIMNNGGTFDGIMVIFDVNGYEKKPNVFGRDVFFTQVRNNKLLPLGAPGTIFSTDRCSRSDNIATSGMACMAKVMLEIDY